MSTRADDIRQQADKALKNTKQLETHINNLEGSSRRDRQQSAAVIAIVAKENPELIEPYTKSVIDALNRPEAQTRWECLDALSEIVQIDARSCERAVQGAETALYDEDSGPLRLAAMRFLCRYGATTENRSEKVWSLIDEGIQCYHGDLEFQDMLIAVVDFSAGKLSSQVKEELAARMKFDAENGKGTLKKRASQIVENLK
ncbi:MULTISPECIES: hypothetical protein [unclassified Adlercreutzia]|uniref:hypothetical protein n=1 Tax=unclassified Adlercreutzia TaxID=2636013 RepID=UPI001F151BCB|nr:MULTISPECIES: hypothetical protein [unclassified Adlercreutzia]